MATVQEFVELITDKTFVQATLSKPRPFSPYKKITIRPVELKEGIKYQVTYKTDLHDQVQNFSLAELKVQIQMWLITNFFFADLKTKNKDIRLMQSKKGQVTLSKKSAYNKEKEKSHDKKKHRLIAEDAPFLRELDLASANGKIYGHGQKKYKQINRYIELIAALVKEDRPTNIVDMGSGKGYLTFALYEYLKQYKPDLKITGIELREDLVDKCNSIAKASGYDGLTFRQGNIEKANIKNAEMVIALHACDIATDMAIAQGVKAKAKYIAVAPCCHKQIRKAMKPTSTVLSPLLKHGIFKERQAEMITDTLRALLLESIGYDTNIMEFISLEHTAKNILITATYSGRKDMSAAAQIEKIKTEFGIESHYLEQLL